MSALSEAHSLSGTLPGKKFRHSNSKHDRVRQSTIAVGHNIEILDWHALVDKKASPTGQKAKGSPSVRPLVMRQI